MLLLAAYDLEHLPALLMWHIETVLFCEVNASMEIGLKSLFSPCLQVASGFKSHVLHSWSKNELVSEFWVLLPAAHDDTVAWEALNKHFLRRSGFYGVVL